MFGKIVDAWPIITTILVGVFGYSDLNSRVNYVEKDVVRVESQAQLREAPISQALGDISKSLHEMNNNLSQRLSKIEGAIEYKRTITR